MFPSCSRSLRLSVNEQAHKKWHLWISSLTQTHTKRDSLSRSLCSSVQVQQRIWSSSIISASFSHFNQASFTVSITSLLKNIHSSSTANLNDSLRLSSCVFDLWKPDESKERERERASKSHVLRNYESHQTILMHGSISLSKWMTWKTSCKALSDSAARLLVDWTPRAQTWEISAVEMEM